LDTLLGYFIDLSPSLDPLLERLALFATSALFDQEVSVMDVDELETVTAIVAVISMMIVAVELRRRERRRRSLWTRQWIQRRETGRGLLSMVHEELATEDRNAFRNFMHMTEEQFREILELVKNDIARQDTAMRESISAEKR
jgi:hypothetical protein